MQSGYKSWLKQMFDTENPHTGLRLADDPSLAIIELQNEDSLLFWTAQGIKGQQLRNLEKLYGDFLIKKVRLARQSQRSLGTSGTGEFSERRRGRLRSRSRRLLYHLGIHAASDRLQSQAFGDQLQFLGETMRDFNAEMVRYLRKIWAASSSSTRATGKPPIRFCSTMSSVGATPLAM
jgi:hypothetical protein